MPLTIQYPVSNAPHHRRDAFTLIELLVSMAVLTVLVLMMTQMLNQASGVWQRSRARIDAFQSARNGFDRVASYLGQATLATYLDYYDTTGKSRTDVLRANPSATFTPTSYDRASDLQFICGQATTLVPPSSGGSRPTHAVFFQAPVGYVSNSASASNDYRALNNLLNAIGYYIDFSNDTALRPGFMTTVAPAWRYRLMELYQPSQNLTIYFNAATAYSGAQAWFTQAANPTGTATVRTVAVADNIVALIVRPEVAGAAATVTAGGATEISPNYTYDTKAYLTLTNTYTAQSKNQLPPLVKVTMVALDTNSAARLAAANGANPPNLYASSPFTDVTQYDADLSALETVLQQSHLNYRVFVSDVSVLGAQWSQTQ